MKKIMVLFGLAGLLSVNIQAADDSSTLGDDALEDVEVAVGKQDYASSDSDPACDDDDGIVKGASYWVEEGFNGIVRQASGTNIANRVLFFGATGRRLKAFSSNMTIPQYESYLDPEAPRPQVKTCRIRYWQGEDMHRCDARGRRVMEGRGRYLVCYDRNGNIIDSFPWSEKRNEVTFSMGKQEVQRKLDNCFCRNKVFVFDFPLDLSKADQRDGHASDDERAVEGRKKGCVVQ